MLVKFICQTSITNSSFHSELPLWERPEGVQSLGGIQRLLVGGEGLADSPGLLGAKVDGLVLLALVELPQVLLLLLVHHDVHAGNGLPDHQKQKENLRKFYKGKK